MEKRIMERLLSDCFKHKNRAISRRKFIYSYTIEKLCIKEPGKFRI